jgi:hypothetical protein
MSFGMTNEELVTSLPRLSKETFYTGVDKFINNDSYQYVYSLPEKVYTPYKYLLTTGEVVKGAARVVFKDQVETHIGLGYTYLGIGLLHKKI